jgi:outer membrane protein
MKIKLFLTSFMLLVLAAPARAQSNFVTNFLKNYHPSGATEAAPPAVPPSAAAQFLQSGEIPINMSDVINMMLDQNLDIQSNRFAPRSSALQTLVFYKVLQPSLTFSANASRNTSFSTSQLNGATNLSQLQHNFSAAYAKTFGAGTTVGVAATMVRLSSNSSLSTFNPSYVGKITYSVSQHFLQNRGSQINLRQVYQSQNNEKISQSQFEVQLTNLLVTAQKSYWDLVFSEGDLKVKQASLDLAKQTLDENQQKVDIGTMAKIDVIQTRLDVAQRNDTVVGAQGTVTLAQDQIKKLISNSNDPSLFLISLKTLEAPHPPLPDDIPTLKEAVATALENRPEIRQAMLDLRNKEIDVQYTKNQKMPIFDVNASFNQNGTGGTQTLRGTILGASTVTGLLPGGVFNAFGQLFSYDYTGFQMGFSLIIPLSNKAADADFSRTVNERKLSTAKMDATTQGIELEVRNALTSLQVAKARYETAGVTLDLSRQTLAAEQAKFDLGTSILKFVLEDQRDVATDESAQLQAEVNYAKALVDLDRAMGMTLNRNKIELNKALQPAVTNYRAD